MAERLLTREEIVEANEFVVDEDYLCLLVRPIIEAQAQKLLKWLNDQMKEYQYSEPETNYYGEVMMQIPRDKWQETLEEVGL